jgi:hypothetical protein
MATRFVVPLIAVLGFALAACSGIGHSFKSDTQTLEKLIVGKTSPDEAARILEGEPYIRQNIQDGSIVWTWQIIVAGAYVGVTDNRLLALQFKSSDGGKTWALCRVLHAQNIDLPAGMPFGAVVK